MICTKLLGEYVMTVTPEDILPIEAGQLLSRTVKEEKFTVKAVGNNALAQIIENDLRVSPCLSQSIKVSLMEHIVNLSMG